MWAPGATTVSSTCFHAVAEITPRTHTHIDHRSGISHRSREIDTPPRVVALKRELAGLQNLASSGEAIMASQLRRMGELKFDIERWM